MPKKIHGRNLQASINKSRTEPRKNTRADLLLFSVLLSTLMKIFLSRSHPAPDMPLRLIHVQYLPRFPGKGWVDLKKSFGDILMYRTLTDPKLFRRLPHSRVIFYNIISNLHGSFLNIIFQKNPPAYILFTMYAGVFEVMLI